MKLSDTYVCKKGFLLAMTDEGEYVPFFVQVRDKDIVPSTDGSFPFGIKLHNSVVYDNIKKISSSIGKAFIEFTFEKWRVKLYSDYSYEAKIRIPINETMFTTRDGNPYILAHKERLPFVSDPEDLYGFLTIESSSSEILSVVPSYSMIKSTGEFTKGYMVEMEMCLANYHNNLIDNIEYYVNSYLNVKVEGNVLLTKA